MNSIAAFLLQFVLILGPILGFWFAKQHIEDKPRRVLIALALAMAAGAAAYVAGAVLGFQPTTRSGRALSLEPIWLFTAFGGGTLVVLLLMTFYRDTRPRS